MTKAPTKPLQKRSQKTRAKLLDVARELIKANGYEALRVEEVVAQAGVAKGTFFAHFKDKDGLMSLLIGEKINTYLDAMAEKTPPKSVPDLVSRMMPLVTFMASERYVFDVIIRHSGSAAIEEIGEIAMSFGRQHEIFSSWMAQGSFRSDVTPDLLSEGIQAFTVQAVALNFCAIHNSAPLEERLTSYLQAWLIVPD